MFKFLLIKVSSKQISITAHRRFGQISVLNVIKHVCDWYQVERQEKKVKRQEKGAL
jgi:hypothetical protein